MDTPIEIWKELKLKLSHEPQLLKSSKFKKVSLEVYQSILMIKDLFNQYRYIDGVEEIQIQQAKLDSQVYSQTIKNQRLKASDWHELSFIYLLNSMTNEQFIQNLYSFYYKFDNDGEGKIQINELWDGIEILAQKNNLGRKKVTSFLQYIGIDINDNLKFFKEGEAAKKVLSGQKIIDFWNYLIRQQNKLQPKQIDEVVEDLEFHTFVPYLISFMIEQEGDVTLQIRSRFRNILGIPRLFKKEQQHIQYYDNDPPRGLFKAIITSQKRRFLPEDTLNFVQIVQSINEFRSSGYSVIYKQNQFDLNALERVIKEAQEKAKTLRGAEQDQYIIKDIFPFIANLIVREILWKQSELDEKPSNELLNVNFTQIKLKVEAAAYCQQLNNLFIKQKIEEHSHGALSQGIYQFSQLLFDVFSEVLPSHKTDMVFYLIYTYINSSYSILEGDQIRINLRLILDNDDIIQKIKDWTWNYQLANIIYKVIDENSFQIRQKGGDLRDLKILENGIMHRIQTNKANDVLDMIKTKVISSLLDKRNQQQINEEQEEIQKRAKLKRILDKYISQTDKNENQKPRYVMESQKIVLLEETNYNPNTQPIIEEEVMSEEYLQMKLQAEANRIDRVFQEKYGIFQQRNQSSKTKAITNNEDLRPSRIFKLIKDSNPASQILELQKYFPQDDEQYDMADFSKFQIAQQSGMLQDTEKNQQRLKRLFGKDSDLYQNLFPDIESAQQPKQIINDNFQFKATEELQQEIQKQKDMKKRKDIQKQDIPKDRSCNCLIV